MWIEWSGDKSTGDTVNHFNTQESGSKRFHFILFIEYQVTRLLWRWFLLLLFLSSCLSAYLSKVRLIWLKCTTHFLISHLIIIRLHAYHQWVRVALRVKMMLMAVSDAAYFFFFLLRSFNSRYTQSWLCEEHLHCFSPFFCLLSFISSSFA